MLDDAKTVAEFGIVEKGFIVCMLAKPKAAPTAPPANAAAAAASASAPSSTAQAAPTPSTAAPPMPQQFGGMDQGDFDDDEDYVEGEEGDEGFEQVCIINMIQKLFHAVNMLLFFFVVTDCEASEGWV